MICYDPYILRGAQRTLPALFIHKKKRVRPPTI